MGRGLKVLIVGSALMGLVACGDTKTIPAQQIQNRAPASAEETGLLVSSVSEEKLSEFAVSHPTVTFRRINERHQIYEVFNISRAELEKGLGLTGEVSKNSFLKLRTSKESLESMTLTPQSLRNVIKANIPFPEKEADDFLQSCKNDFSKEPQVKVNLNLLQPDSALVGTKVALNLNGSKTNDPSNLLATLLLLRTPEDSAQEPFQLYKGFNLDFTMDTSGDYSVIVVAKNASGYCKMVRQHLYATENPKFDPSTAISDADAESTDLSGFWQLALSNAKAAWSESTGVGALVAVVDTGVNYNHPMLAKNIYVNPKEIAGNNKDDDGNGYVDDLVGWDFGYNDAYPFDDYGHGTHCAGISASSVFGLAKNAKILAVKVGAGSGVDLGSVVGGILYAVDMGATVINMSLGFESDVKELRAAIAYAERNGVVIVAAAGNGDDRGQGMNNDVTPMYPASYTNSNLIAVAALNILGNKTEYSNYGAKSVHLGASGGDNLGDVISAAKKNPKGASLWPMSGTSMAAPTVAGAVALVQSKNPKATPAQVRELLMKTGDAESTLANVTVSGNRLNAAKAVSATYPMGRYRTNGWRADQ